MYFFLIVGLVLDLEVIFLGNGESVTVENIYPFLT